MAFLRGDAASTPRLILTMIRHLPEGSNYVAALQSAPAAELEEPEDEPAEIDPVQEYKLWTTDKLLMAQLINSVNMLIRYSIEWKDGKAPDMPLVGPAKWRDAGDKSTPTKPVSVMAALNTIMGQR